MKTLLTTLTALALAAPNGDREEGLRLYREGRYAAAQAAFLRALEATPDAPELQWNLALAAWRAGDLVTAETAAEKYAAAAASAAEDRHRGMLGAIRYAEAEALEQQAAAAAAAAAAPPSATAGPDDEPPADPMPLLEQAVQKAFQAKNHFVRAVRAKPTPELVRNTERAVRKLDELKKQLEDLMQQQQQGQDGEPKDGEPGEGDPQDSDAQEGQEQGEPEQGDPQQGDPQRGDPQQSEPQQGDPQAGDPQQGDPSQPPPEAPEPQPEQPSQEPGSEPQAPAERADASDPEPGERDAVPEPRAEAPEPDDGKARGDAPGEGAVGRELTPEQAKRLLDRLKEMEKQMKAARARARGGRKPVRRDW